MNEFNTTADEQHISEFCEWMRAQVDAFRADYVARSNEEPADWPHRMENLEWAEQFAAWMGLTP